MPFVHHKFGKTFYKKSGIKNKNIPLICLHGGPGGTHHYFDPIHEWNAKLPKKQQRQIISYDQIGTGKSTALKTEKQIISTFVQDLEFLRKHLKIDQFHMAGGSWGTTLALEYYLATNGKYNSSIIFQSPMFSAKDWENDAKRLIKKLPPKTQKIINYCHEIGATDSKVYQKAVMNYYLKHVLRDRKKLFNTKRPPNPNGKAVYLHMWGPSEFKPTGNLKTYRKVGSLKKIKCPVKLIVGQYDEATPETAKKYSKKIKDCDFSVIKNASHSILGEKPEEMIRLMNTFLKNIEG